MTRYFLQPVETEGDLPKFCGDCGRELLREREPGMFDRYTGRQLPGTSTARCPRWQGNSGRHEGFVVLPRPQLPSADPGLLGKP